MTREQPAAPAQPSPEAAAPEDWAAERAALARLFPHAADQIVPRARAAMARAIEREDAAMQVEATAWCARALTALGQADDAARLAHEVLATAVADDPARRAQLLAALGLAYEGLGRYADALDLHQEAHDLLEAHGDERGVASARLSMGVLHSRCNDHAIGLGHYEAALATFERYDDAPSIIRVLNNIGLNHRNLGQYEASLAAFDRAIALANEHGLPGLVVTLGGNRARTLVALGRLDEAEAHFSTYADAIAGNRWFQSAVDARLAMAEIAALREQHERVEACAAELLTLLAEHPMLDSEVKLWSLLAETREKRGDMAGALTAFKRLREAEARWVDQRAGTRLRASTLMSDLAAARRRAEEEAKLRDQLAEAHAALAIEAAERRARAEELYRQSREDGLTGLPNRRAFGERVAEECRLTELHDEPLCLAIVDVDHFKRVNDTYGHAAGDLVLVAVASRLRAAAGARAWVARLGGEEFVVLFPHADLDAAARMSDALRAAICAEPVVAGEVPIPVSASFGLTAFNGGEDPEAMLERADQALYAAKTAGRNRVCVWRAP